MKKEWLSKTGFYSANTTDKRSSQPPPSSISSITGTHHPGITSNATRDNGKTPRNYNDDPGMQVEILLSRISKENPRMGIKLPRLQSKQENKSNTNPPKNAEQHRTHSGPEDCLEIDILPNIPSSAGYKYDRCILQIFICLPNTRYDCQNSRKKHRRRNDKTLLFAKIIPI